MVHRAESAFENLFFLVEKKQINDQMETKEDVRD